MKKLIVIITLICMLMAFSGCGAPKPDATVDAYFAAAQKLDVEAMALTIVPSNTQDLEETKNLINEEKQDDYTKYFLDYLKSNAGKIAYTITGSEVDGDSAIVTVDCKYVDGGPLLKATIGEAFLQIFQMAFSGVEATEEEMGQMFVSIMEEQSAVLEETYKESTVKINLTMQEGTWYISEVSDEMADVIMSGFISSGKEIADSFSELED